jgi:hypothetical protein
MTEQGPSFVEKINVQVTVKDVIEAINLTKDLSDKVKDISLDILDRHSGEEFSSLEGFLNVGFSPEVVDALKLCNEIIQLFSS